MQSILKPLQLEQKELASSRRKSVVPTESRRELHQSLPFSDILKRIPWKQYFFHLPVLFLGLVAYGAVIFILGWVEPRSIQHLLIPNSYILLLLAAAAGHFFCGSYIFLNTRRGLLLSITLTIILFLKLQQVLTWQLAIFTVVATASIEGIYLLGALLFRHLGINIPVPHLPKFRHKEIPMDIAPIPEDVKKISSSPPKPRPRKHGRPRKHRFFGK